MDDQRKELRKLVAQLRPVQGVRSTTREYRNLDEQNDARTVLEAAGLQFTNLRHRGEGRDPPDCEAEINGVRCGIELTEFVHRRRWRSPSRPTRLIVVIATIMSGPERNSLSNSERRLRRKTSRRI
jgi:hypothetical protein